MNSVATPGTVWVCAACGKTAHDRVNGNGGGWDESCFLHAVLCDVGSLEYGADGRVKRAVAVKVES